jgi:hypothetical protein
MEFQISIIITFWTNSIIFWLLSISESWFNFKTSVLFLNQSLFLPQAARANTMKMMGSRKKAVSLALAEGKASL